MTELATLTWSHTNTVKDYPVLLADKVRATTLLYSKGIVRWLGIRRNGPTDFDTAKLIGAAVEKYAEEHQDKPPKEGQLIYALEEVANMAAKGGYCDTSKYSGYPGALTWGFELSYLEKIVPIVLAADEMFEGYRIDEKELEKLKNHRYELLNGRSVGTFPRLRRPGE